jgi:hypothetical protein
VPAARSAVLAAPRRLQAPPHLGRPGIRFRSSISATCTRARATSTWRRFSSS